MPSVLNDAKIALQMLDKAHKEVMGDTENPAATGNHHAALFGMAIAAGVEVLLRAEIERRMEADKLEVTIRKGTMDTERAEEVAGSAPAARSTHPGADIRTRSESTDRYNYH